MGSFNFRWEHPAQEVFVTGTFDNWGKTILLDKSGSAHEKSVELPASEEKILYKFVADGNWSHDHTAKTETDHEGNINNVLYPQDIKPSASTAAISSVAPGATTAAMAGAQPLESSREEEEEGHLPGAFPQTPAAVETRDTFGESSKEDPPLPSVPSAAEDNSQTFGVNPLPATGGIGNPVSLQPGEKVPEPSSITGNTIDSNVRLDQASYEKSDAGAPVLPAPLSPGSEAEAAGTKSIFGEGLGPQTTNMIPESSMGMGKDTPAAIDSQSTGPAISSVAPQSTTNQLAGQQPLEDSHSPPPVVTESIQQANVDPEAAASPRAVQEKDEMESELHSKVPEAPATSESGTKSSSGDGVLGMAMGGVGAAGAAAAGAAYMARDKVTESTGNDKAIESTGPHSPPPVVTESIQQANADPEAAASPRAVQEKDEVENELHSKVPEAPATSESPADTKTSSGSGMMGMAMGGVGAAGAAAAGAAFMARDKVTGSTGKDPISYLPPSVQDSINNMNNKGSSNEATPATQAVTAPRPITTASEAQIPQQTHVGQGIEIPAQAGAGDERNVASSVPQEVLASQKEAKVDPEAASSPRAVQEKNEMESELMSKVPESTATGEPAPDAAHAAALSSTAPLATTSTSDAPLGTTSAAGGAPQLGDPTAGVAALSMDDSKPAAAATEGSKELNAPASEPAVPPTSAPSSAALAVPETPAAQKVNTLAAQAHDDHSRDVSPMTKSPGDAARGAAETGGQTAPQVTTGVDSSSAPAQSTPTAGKPVGTPRTGRDNAPTPQKRQSFIDRMKGTPESQKSVGGASDTSKASESGGGKKKGFLKRLADKLK